MYLYTYVYIYIYLIYLYAYIHTHKTIMQDQEVPHTLEFKTTRTIQQQQQILRSFSPSSIQNT